MKRTAMAAAVAGVIATAACGGPSGHSPPPGGIPAPSSPPGVSAAAIYRDRCAACHGSRGQGGIGTKLAGRVGVRFPSVDQEIAEITHGAGRMPGFQGALTPEQIRAVAEYTRSL